MVDAFRRLLVPTDFSELSTLAARYARTLAAQYGSAVHIVHVLPVGETVPSAPHTLPAANPPQDAEQYAACRRTLEQFAADLLAGTDAAATTEVLQGHPPDAICACAQEQQVDTIIMGTHGGGMLRRLFLGSTSKAVVERAPCPVLLVPASE